MSLIILPTATAPTLDPDRAAEMVHSGDLVPDAPLCQRCGVKASFTNPVGVTMRRSWNPLDTNPRAGLDAICSRCREALAR